MVLTFYGVNTIIDDNDFPKIKGISFSLKIDKKTDRIYFTAILNKKRVLLHRLIMNAKQGDIIDHKNRHDTTDNRKSNLRFCTNAQNMWNSKRYKNNKSGIKCVTWDKDKSKYRVRITVNKKRISLGYYDKIEDAKKISIEAIKKYHKEFGREE